MKETWKPISNFEGFYEISNSGRVKSLDRLIEYQDGRKQKHNGKILTISYPRGF